MKVYEPLEDEEEPEFDLCEADGHFYTEYNGKLYCWMCGIYLAVC